MKREFKYSRSGELFYREEIGVFFKKNNTIGGELIKERLSLTIYNLSHEIVAEIKTPEGVKI